MTTVAVLGTGIMGSGIARSLLRSGATVRAWNRTREKAESLRDDGATVHDRAADAAAGADVVLTMLFDSHAVDAVMDEVLPAMAGGDAVWVQSGTVGTHATERFAMLAERQGVGFVDAPVLGTREPAEQGALIVLAAGRNGLRDAVAPVLGAIGSRTVWVSERPGDGHRLKLSANSWVLSVVAATAQAVGLARASGLDPQLFLDAIAGGPADCAYAQLKGKAMIAREFPPSFTLGGAAKDARLIVAALHGLGLDASLMEAVSAQMELADHAGHGPDDMAAVITAVENAG